LGLARPFVRACPTITRATQDLVRPQTTNFDLVGGIHFRKGCYPGQEIVARMQYLGRLKERAVRISCGCPPPSPATPIFGEGESAVGTVVNAAPARRAAAISSPSCRSQRPSPAACASVHAMGHRCAGLELPYRRAPARARTASSFERTTHYYIWYRLAGDFVDARAAVAAVLRDVCVPLESCRSRPRAPRRSADLDGNLRERRRHASCSSKR
jgi:folate-binding protein YgfZ